MSNRPISLNSLPSIASIYTKQLTASTDGTKRDTVHSYSLHLQSMPLSAQPLSGENKTKVGIEFSKEAYTGYTLIDYDGLFDVGDIVKYKSKYYTIKEVMSFDEGPTQVQHVKFIFERLPVPPKGLI